VSDAPRVLHVVDNLGVGGAEVWLMELLRHWAANGAVRMDFLATSGHEGTFDAQARALGAEIHYLKYGRGHIRRFTAGIRRILREGGYDAVHDHHDYASGWHYLAAGAALPPVRISHVHSPWMQISVHYGGTLQRRLAASGGKQLTARLASHICGTSGDALQRYGFPIRRGRRPAVSVVHCGIDVGRYSGDRAADRASVLAEFGFPADAKLVLFVGRLDRDLALGHPRNHKNSWLATLISREAATIDPSVRLLMAGAGDVQREQLRYHIAGWGLADRLKLIGVRDDVGRLMRAADALLFPSAEEGLGMVAVEAQAAGLPVLASTAVPREAIVVPDMFESLSTDEPAERWAQALLAMMRRPKANPRCCAAALDRSEFSIAASARALERLYGSGR
jgi:glycosyltransferase involved in cell wall biosynthesis